MNGMESVLWKDEYDKMIVLAEVDESESYEVDQAMIGLNKDDGKFGFMMASGCSCWDGDGEINYFDDLDSMETFILNNLGEGEERSNFYISINGCKQLIAEAKNKFKEYALKAFE